MKIDATVLYYPADKTAVNKFSGYRPVQEAYPYRSPYNEIETMLVSLPKISYRTPMKSSKSNTKIFVATNFL